MYLLKAPMWKCIPMDLAAYFCTLWLFRDNTNKQLENHDRTFRPHVSSRSELEGVGIYLRDETYIQESVTPYLFSDVDFERLAREES